MKQKKIRKLFVPLWASLIIPITVLFIAFSFLVVFSVARSTNTIVNNFSIPLTQKTSGEIEALVEKFLGEAHTFQKSIIASSNSGIVDLDNMPALAPLLYQYAEISELIRTFYYGDLNEQTCYMSLENEGTGVLGIQEIQDIGKMNFYEILPGGIRGSFIEAIDFIVTQRPWFMEAAQNLHPGFTDIYVDAVTKGLVISPYTPVFSGDSSFRGVLGSDMSLDSLVKLIDKANTGSGTHSVIVDENGYLVAAYSGLDIVNTVNDELERIQIDQSQDKVIASIYRHIPSLDAVSASTFSDNDPDDMHKGTNATSTGNILTVNNADNWYDILSVNGKRYFSNVKTLNSNSGIKWKIITYLSLTDALKNAVFIYMPYAIIILVMLALGFFLIFTIVRRTTKDVNNVMKAIETVSTGNLDIEIGLKSNNEVYKIQIAIERLVESLSSISDEIKNASSRSNEGADELAAHATETAATIVEMEANINSMRGQAERMDGAAGAAANAESAMDTASRTMANSVSDIETAIRKTQELSLAMTVSLNKLAQQAEAQKITASKVAEFGAQGKEKADETGHAMKRMEESASRTLELVDIINSIAGQTNLLAMNAAIEAAHAGEAGRGFAVVADEIRKLSESSAENARGISQTIQENSKAIEEATGIAELTKEAMDSIIFALSDLVKELGNVSRSLSEAAGQGQEVSSAMEVLSSSEAQLSEATRSLEDVSQTMAQTVADVRNLAAENRAAASEISQGMREIGSSAQKLSELSRENADISKQINSSLAFFK